MFKYVIEFVCLVNIANKDEFEWFVTNLMLTNFTRKALPSNFHTHIFAYILQEAVNPL